MKIRLTVSLRNWNNKLCNGRNSNINSNNSDNITASLRAPQRLLSLKSMRWSSLGTWLTAYPVAPKASLTYVHYSPPAPSIPHPSIQSPCCSWGLQALALADLPALGCSSPRYLCGSLPGLLQVLFSTKFSVMYYYKHSI